MKNKAIIFGSIIVLLAGGIFLMLWRANIMGADAKRTAGGLVAVNSKGTPVPVPAGQAAAGGLPENTAMQEANGLLVSLTLAPYPPAWPRPAISRWHWRMRTDRRSPAQPSALT